MIAKMVCLFLFFLCVVGMGGCIAADVFATYDYNNRVGSYWSLSDKSSTLQQKSAYLDKFVEALDSAHLADYDAIWLKMPDNSVEQNKIALKSLQSRMHEIVGMDPNSLQYQQALAQITAQEQGQAEHMLAVFSGAWFLENHFLLWGWVKTVFGSVLFGLAFTLGILVLSID